jgi:hypothetical protein
MAAVRARNARTRGADPDQRKGAHRGSP